MPLASQTNGILVLSTDYVPHVLYTPYMCSLLQSSYQFHEIGTIVNFILQVRKLLRLREINLPRITLLVLAELRFTTRSKAKFWGWAIGLILHYHKNSGSEELWRTICSSNTSGEWLSLVSGTAQNKCPNLGVEDLRTETSCKGRKGKCLFITLTLSIITL